MYLFQTQIKIQTLNVCLTCKLAEQPPLAPHKHKYLPQMKIQIQTQIRISQIQMQMLISGSNWPSASQKTNTCLNKITNEISCLKDKYKQQIQTLNVCLRYKLAASHKQIAVSNTVPRKNTFLKHKHK